MQLIQLAAYFGLATAIGLLMGVLGGGGGGIYLIVLIAALRLPAAQAVGASLVLSAITLSGAAIQYWRQGLVRKDYLGFLAASGVAGVIAASLALSRIPESFLLPAIVALFVISGLSSLIKVGRGSKDAKEAKPARQVVPGLIGTGLVSGLLSGTLGLSGTTPLTSFLIGVFDLDPRMAVGTTTLVTLAVSAAGGAFHLGSGSLDWRIILIFGSGSILGSSLGAILARKINRKAITVVIAILAVGSGIYLAFRH